MHVFYDVSKPLTGCDIWDLFFKLKQLVIDGDVLKWVSNYLDNRQQRVVIKSCKSNFRSTNAGVPQGSVLGPLLFLIYINHIAESLLSITGLFADDSSLFYSPSIFTTLKELSTILSKYWLPGLKDG